jgi:hypothetical protein
MGLFPISSRHGLRLLSSRVHSCLALIQIRLPVAVGVVVHGCDHVKLHGKSGKAVRILHSYLDQIWNMGDKSVPNAVSMAAVDEDDAPIEHALAPLHLSG